MSATSIREFFAILTRLGHIKVMFVLLDFSPLSRVVFVFVLDQLILRVLCRQKNKG